jgi:hypothetical protein
MVQQTLAESDRLTKQAMEGEVETDESKKKKKDGPPASPQTPAENASTAPERNEEAPAEAEKTSAAFVEKLASALEYCNEHFLKEAVGKPEPPTSHTPPQASKDVGAGKGTGAYATDLDTAPGGGGMQSTETGEATSQQQAPKNPPKDVASPGQVNPDNALLTDMKDRPGGSEDWTNTDKMKQAQVRRVFGIMKRAADAENPAKIKAKITNPHQSSPEGADVAEAGVPSQPGEVTKQKSMIASNMAAINYKKKKAKDVPKARMGEVLSEPAQKKSTDPVLHNNLSNTGKAGVKIASAMESAAARALLIKIAEEGAAEDAPPEKKEKAEKLKEMLLAKGAKEKTSTGDMPVGGGY